MRYLKRYFYNWWTAHRIRMMLQYGSCPLCNSSPPGKTCYVCWGSYMYGSKLSIKDKVVWAHRYVEEREIKRYTEKL